MTAFFSRTLVRRGAGSWDVVAVARANTATGPAVAESFVFAA